ncbi:Mannosylglycerate synthase [Porphyridium purpureum]|uniref:Mannosylglycerate synthase n=1 Tax=Porphyridium purpureum TaxID=35688 RepID=A0A5J4YT47_PORPP|nr:Mannosylglycerate synthase [Porphyridium purpureum]|eukprot:POR3673..scf227_4
MALVCFPFKKEDVDVVMRNVKTAAQHPRVRMVLLVGASENETYVEIDARLPALGAQCDVPIVQMTQLRLGALREGKGDGMNTALLYFLRAHEYDELFGEPVVSEPLERIHFYDADIESFNSSWITKAEEAADMEYDVIRHYFPRSSTDAQITWQITKVGFSLLFPLSVLPWVQQPLGGELCLTRRCVDVLVSDERVMRQSDWGIDTLYTFVCAQAGMNMIEVYVPEGKLHALYGGLRDLFNMLIECFAALQGLQKCSIRAESVHRIASAEPVPNSVTSKIGYNIEKSLVLLSENWTPRQEELLHVLFPERVAAGLIACRDWPQYSFMDEATWVECYQVLLANFEFGDSDWHELIFKLWVSRVLNYTMRHVIRGYDTAMNELRHMVQDIQQKSAIELIKARREAQGCSPRVLASEQDKMRRVPSELSLFSDEYSSSFKTQAVPGIMNHAT